MAQWTKACILAGWHVRSQVSVPGAPLRLRDHSARPQIRPGRRERATAGPSPHHSGQASSASRGSGSSKLDAGGWKGRGPKGGAGFGSVGHGRPGKGLYNLKGVYSRVDSGTADGGKSAKKAFQGAGRPFDCAQGEQAPLREIVWGMRRNGRVETRPYKERREERRQRAAALRGLGIM